MTYSLTFSLGLGPTKTNLTDLRAQLFDTAGTAVGTAISTGFVDLGTGYYSWYTTAIPDAHRGGVKFYSNATPTTILAICAINPEETEQLAAIATVDGIVDDILVDTAELQTDWHNDGRLDLLLDSAATMAGNGSITFTYTLTNSTTALPITTALVEVFTDATLLNLVASGYTNASGIVVFYLDAGTYYLRRSKSGFTFTNPDTEVVA